MKRALVSLLLVAAACRKPQQQEKTVTVLVTPEVAHTGVARAVTDAFVRQAHVPLRVQTVSPQEVLASAEARSGAVAIYRDATLDDELRARRAIRLRSVLAVEDYVIVGPANDPANVARAKTADDAFESIVEHDRVFCSPVDVPVLLAEEENVFAAGEVERPGGKLYRRCHGKAAEVLAEAERMHAYSVTDRATAESVLPKNLRVLLSGVPILHNEYVIAQLEYVQANRNRNADWLVEWAMSYRGAEAVQNLRVPMLPKLYPPHQR